MSQQDLHACGDFGMNRPAAFPSMDKHQPVAYNMYDLPEIIKQTLLLPVFIMHCFEMESVVA